VHLIEPAKRCDNLLVDLGAFPVVFDDLNQAAWVPEEGKKALREWVDSDKKACETLKNAVNNGYTTQGHKEPRSEPRLQSTDPHDQETA
jgi:predicted nucleotidyltransferase